MIDRLFTKFDISLTNEIRTFARLLSPRAHQRDTMSIAELYVQIK